MTKKAPKGRSAGGSKPSRGERSTRAVKQGKAAGMAGYADISEDEVDKFYAEKEKILLQDSDEASTGELSFDEEAIMDLPTESDEQDEEDEEKWGRTKKAYYSADKEVLEEEAAEAKKLQRKRLEAMKFTDFTDGRAVKVGSKKDSRKGPISLDFDDEEASEDAEEEECEGDQQDLEYSEDDDDEAEFNLDSEQVANLSAEERMELLEKHSVEFKALVTDFKERLGYLEGHLQPLMAKLEQLSTSKGLEFLKVKYQLLAGYCTNVAFYLQLKLRGKPIMNHPVLERLVKYRLLLEKIKPMEAKLKHQVDRLLRAAAGQTEGEEGEGGKGEATKFRPNPDMLVKGEGSSGDEEGLVDDGLYKAPKLAPVPYFEDKGATARRQKHEERQRKTNASSQLIRELRAEVEDVPDEEAIDVVYGSKGHSKGGRDIAARNEYEEENYVRFTLDKKAKQRLREQVGKPIDELEDLNDFIHDIDTIKRGSRKQPSKAISKLVGKRQRSGSLEDEEVEDQPRPSKGRKEQFAEDESEIEDDLVDDFYSKAKAAKQAKKDMKPRPVSKGPVRFQPIKDMGGEGSRPATWKMMKNKGLTVNRPKETRNPRVKQRKRYERAEKRLGSFRAVSRPQSGKYAGEETGIRTNIKRSVKF